MSVVTLDIGQLRITRSVIQQIEQTIGLYPPECGGILGAKEDGIISEFYFDRLGESSSEGYSPDVESINSILINDWMPRGIYMVGIVHSHSQELYALSCGDIRYGIQILQALDTVDAFYLPVVTVSLQRMILHPYVVYSKKPADVICKSIPLTIVDFSIS